MWQGGYPGNPPAGMAGMAPLSPPSLPSHMTAPNKHLPPLPGQNSASPHHSIGGPGGGGVISSQSHSHGGSNDHLENKSNMMELSDLHHPSCKLNQSRQGSFDEHHGGPDPDGADLDDRYIYHSTQKSHVTYSLGFKKVGTLHQNQQ